MKKRGILTIIITLLLTISTIAVLSASNSPPPIFLNSSSNNIGTITKSYIGNGNPLNSTLYITNNYNNTPNATNTDSNIYVPCPSGWEILWANLTLSNINAPNTTLASNYTTTNTTLDLSNLTAMSFRLTNNAYLDSVSAQLTATLPLPTADFYVYNAGNNSGRPIPLVQIASNTSIPIQSGTNWVNVSFGHIFLDISGTYNKTFFIAIKKTSVPPTTFQWNAVLESSPPGNGYVYQFNSTSTSWVENQSCDCQLAVSVSASNNTPADIAFPSEIGLTINGSQVQNISKGIGGWTTSTASPVSNGYIFYDVNSTWMSTVSFSYGWNITMNRSTYATALTNFNVSPGTGASWNITVNANNSDSFPLTNGVNHINITGTPPDWTFTNSMVYNVSGSQWISLDSRPPDNISFTAGNGTWIVNCTAPNHVSSISFDVGGIPVANATLYDNLNITANFTPSVSGTVNLSIYDPSQTLNYTAGKTVTSATSTKFVWNVSNNATSTGPYNVTISYKDGSMVGYNETTLLIVPLTNTSLTVTSYPPNVQYPNLVPITLYYNRTDNGQGLPGASIAAYEGLTPLTIYSLSNQGNGSYSLNLNFSTDIGVHNVYFNASGLRLFSSNVSNTISINYTRELVGITIGFQVGGVPVANATLYDNLNITVTFAASVSGTVNLSVYDPSQILNYTAGKTVTSATSTWFIWDVSNNATSTGTYKVTISLEGTLEVGYNETLLKIVPLTNTSLTVTSYPPNVQYPNLVPITLYYNDTDHNSGVAGATITAYFANSTPATIQGNVDDQGNGFYSLNLTFGTGIGVQTVYFNAGSLRLFEPSNSSPISVNYTGTPISITIGFYVGGVSVPNATNATLPDSLNITVTFATSVSGNVNLSIYDPSQTLNYTAENTVNSATSTWFIWDISNNATSTGTYKVTISYVGALTFGYNEKNLSIVSLISTSLTVTSNQSNVVEYPGLVPVTLNYSGTDGQGLINASIAAFANSLPVAIQGPVTDYGNGSYSLNLNFSTNIGFYSVIFNASNVRLYNYSVSSPISVNYTPALVSLNLSTPLSVPLSTSLVVNAQLLYNSSGLPVVGETVYFNFSVRLSDNSTIILHDNGTTSSTGWTKGTAQVPSNAVELNVTAFYIGKTTVSGATSSTNPVTLTSAPVNPPNTGLVGLMFLMQTQQGQSFVLYPLLAAVVGAVVVGSLVTDRARRRHAVPLKALASLENIIVDHLSSGVTIWAFDFLKMEQDVTLVSGFMSAVKSFLREMHKGGLRKLETEFGTFIREDGDILTATCITSGGTQEEEKWIREKLHSFISIAERQNWDKLMKWSGEVTSFKPKFLETLSSLIDLEKAEQLQREKVLKVLRERERLRVQLNNLGSKLETLNQQLSDRKISKAEFEAQRAEIEPKYERIQMDYIRATILVSKAPYTLETTWETPEAREEMEKIREKFIKITMEIDALHRKAQGGRVTSKELKRKEDLTKELTTLIEKLDEKQAE